MAEAGPPYHHDGKVDSDQYVVDKEPCVSLGRAPGEFYPEGSILEGSILEVFRGKCKLLYRKDTEGVGRCLRSFIQRGAFSRLVVRG